MHTPSELPAQAPTAFQTASALQTASASKGAAPGRRRTRNPLLALCYLLAFALLALCSPFVLSAAVLVLSLCFVGVGLFLVVPMAKGVQGFARLHRRLAASWAGTPVREFYLPHANKPAGWAGTVKVLRSFTDPTVRRDWIFLLTNSAVGLLLAILAPVMVLEGLWLLVAAAGWEQLGVASWDTWFAFVYTGWADGQRLFFFSGVGLVLLGLLLALPFLKAVGGWIKLSLASPPESVLRARVEQLESTRRDAVDLQQAEIKRIERDLHDGAQARLVGVGMSIARAQQLMNTDPEAATRMLDEAKGQSTQALDELRSLVRGIRPPVLADRGLAEALKALAAAVPLESSVQAQELGRLNPAIENAAYFAAAELVANAVKHARATRIELRLSASRGALELTVEDDGRGMLAAALDSAAAEQASPERAAGAGGLPGLRQRLAALDGVLELDDRQGQGTRARVSLPLPQD